MGLVEAEPEHLHDGGTPVGGPRTASRVIQRHFLPWDEPALPAAARFLAERYADGDTLSLERVVVVVQAARAGRRLTELLIEEAEERGLLLTPPEAITPRSLPERLLVPGDGRVAGRIESLTQWAEALRALEPSRRAEVFPRVPGPDDLPGWIELARLVRGLHEELAAEGLGFADVVRALRRGTGFDDSGRWAVLSAAGEEVRRRLSARGLTQRDDARWEAVEQGRVRLDGELVLVGVVELAAVARKMLRQLDAPIAALVHAPEELADTFDELGCVDPGAWGRRPIEIPEAAIRIAGRPPEQADEVVRCLCGPGEALAPDEVTIGVPDRELVPYLEQRLGAYGIPHRSAAGTRLPHTDPYRLLEAVADYLEERRYPDFAALLRHPGVEASLGIPRALDISDETYSRRLPARVDGRRPGGGAFQPITDALDRRLELGSLRGRRAVSAWTKEIMGLLGRVYEDEGHPLDRTRPGDRRLVEALEALRDAAAAWAAPGAEPEEPCEAPAAIRLLLGEVREEAVPPMADRSAVEMLGWLELHLDDAPVLVLTGMDEGHVPGSVDADLFLPDGLRNELGLADDARRGGRDAYLLSAMLASREALHVVVGRRTADGDPLRPSRLLMAVEGQALARRVERLFRPREAPGRLPRPGLVPAERSAFRTPPEPVIAVTTLPASLPVTAFRRLLSTPYQFALEDLLELSERDDTARELDALLFGELAHTVLQRFGSSEAAGWRDVEAVRSRMDELLEEVFEEKFGRGALPAVRLQARQLGARLGSFAEWHVGWLEEGWETVALEVETPEGGVPFDVDGAEMRLTGRIDRIDRHRSTGAFAVLDYKTSAKPRKPEATHRGRDGRWRDLQLPLYRCLLPGIAESGALPADLLEPGLPVTLGYVNLSREPTSEALASWTPADLEDAYEAARECVRRLRAGEIAYEAEERVPSYSPFAALLGRGRLRSGQGDEPDDGGEEGA
jgi:ATP-dependent helicase/nuclease subunit B